MERLREYLSMAVKTKEISSDSKMASSTKEVLLMIEGFKANPVDETMIKKVLKIQDLVKEIQN